MAGVTPKTRQLVLARADGCCERCGRGLDPIFYSLQHRRARGIGGSRRDDTNTPVNLGALCGSATSPDGCHLWVESHPRLASGEGWRVAQFEDPALVPVLTWHGWVLFSAGGGYARVLEAS